jgi:hypothetical protein
MTQERQSSKGQTPKAKAPALLSFDEFDGRYGATKKLKQRANELFRLATKRDAFTAERCRRIALLEQSVRAMEASMNGGEPGGTYIQAINTLERLYGELGVEAGNSDPKAALKSYLAGEGE